MASGEREAAPDFRLASVDGGELGSEDFEGRVILLDFWATWCGPCHVQAEILEPLYEEFRHQGLEIFSIDLGEEEAKVQAFLEKNPVPYPVLMDFDGEVSDRYGVFALPTVLIIDRQGQIAFTRGGITGADTLRSVIEAELAVDSTRPPTTTADLPSSSSSPSPSPS
ncbi:MAG: TlpA family protein disulfide reductase [Deltaproteobacteria bacterium]|nr:TlpA family protein disulfide reductase [Deltaproteobacteria bacterium]